MKKLTGFTPLNSAVPTARRRYLTGFTLIELLIVVAIIGILATIVIINLTGAKARSNDARRKSDVASIKKAVDAFQSEYDRYPVCQDNGRQECKFSQDTSGTSAVGVNGIADLLDSGDITKLTNYLQTFPTDPKMERGGNGHNFYAYADIPKDTSAPGSYYGIKVAMEVFEGNLSESYVCSAADCGKKYYYCRTGTGLLLTGMWNATSPDLCDF